MSLFDRLVALALHPNRIKNRELWDIGWLKQQNQILVPAMVAQKIGDRRCSRRDFLDRLSQRIDGLEHDPDRRESFVAEMRRFLPRRR